VAQLDSNELITVGKHLYRLCALDKGVDAVEITKISMKDFVTWCVEHNEPHASKEMFVNKLGVRPIAIEAIDSVFNGCPWQCASILFPVWYVIVLSHRPPLTNALHFVHVAITAGYRDGKVAQMQGVKEMAPGMVNTDGFLCAFISDQTRHMLQQMCHLGFDKLHDDYAVHPAESQASLTPRQEMPQPPPRNIGW
jgi:hypothetical protein